MNEDKRIKKAIETIKNSYVMSTKHCLDDENVQLRQAIEAVLKELENSIPKDVIRQKINERQFELQQEYKDFKDDIRLNTLQEIYYLQED